jgi:transposase
MRFFFSTMVTRPTDKAAFHLQLLPPFGERSADPTFFLVGAGGDSRGVWRLRHDVMGADPFDGSVYVFRAKRADRVKLVIWDGTGVCLFAKRLEDGRFQWPKVENGVMRLSPAQLSALVEGLDWRRAGAAKNTLAPRRFPTTQRR